MDPSDLSISSISPRPPTPPPSFSPGPPNSATPLRKDSLQEELLHHAVQRPVQGGIIEQGAWGAQPAVEVDHLVVRIDVVVLRDLLHPAHHQALQNPAWGRERKPCVVHPTR